jgi:hypothetical protein
MYNRKNSRLDERRLQQYNDMKPVTKRVLGMTIRAAGKMMKLILKTAFYLPGMVKRLVSAVPTRSSQHPAAMSEAQRRFSERNN